MYNNILVGVLYLNFLLFVRLLVYRGLENIDGYTFSRGTQIMVHIVLTTYKVNVLLII